jgi:hypothetical protein
MATTNNITTTYAGEWAQKYISPALLSGTTLANQLVTIVPNVKHKQVISKISLDDVVKDGTCDFDPTSTITQTERILEPTELQTNLQLCKKDYHNTWMAIEQGYSAHDDLPKSFADYLIGYVAGKVAARIETLIYQGDSANPHEFDGYEKLFATDAALPAAQEVAGTTITDTNVIAELNKIVDAIPSALYGGEDTIIYASQNIVRAYIRSLGGFAALGDANTYNNNAGINNQGTMWYTTGTGLSVGGVNIVMSNGLSDNTAFATQRENLFFGTGLLSDHNEVKVIDTADTLGDQNVRVVMRYTAGVQVGNIEDVVTYGILNTVNPA